jgi:hypothetical protein
MGEDTDPDPTDSQRVHRALRLACIAAAAVALAAFAAAAQAAPGLIVGVSDDSVKWAPSAKSSALLGYARDLGLDAVRITVPWQPGQTELPVTDRRPVDRAIVTTWGTRTVLAVYGKPDDAPTTPAARTQYCTFVASLLRRYPAVDDVVIWNEPNSSRFWRPQFDETGASVAPAQYEALLATCYDVLHATRQTANVIAPSAPRGTDRPLASGGGSTSPGAWYRGIGKAYRASGRDKPIFDTIGHNAYPDTNAERPWQKHPSSNSIDQGDYTKLMGALTDAFGGTAQPLPGQGRVTIWYMEDGFQTSADPAKQGLYTGTETDKQALPALAPRATSGTSTTSGPAPDQATQLGDALRLAYCQPGVGAFFNFELVDEADLGGWQSGVLWADATPKPSFQSFKQAIADVRAGKVDCTRYADAPEKAKPSTPALEQGLGFTQKTPVVTAR